MRITDCDNMKKCLEGRDSQNDMVFYDCYLSDGNYDTLTFMLTDRNDNKKHMYVHVKYAKDKRYITYKLQNVIEKSYDRSKFILMNACCNPIYIDVENRLEHEFINAAMEYIRMMVKWTKDPSTQKDFENYMIDFWQFT